MHCQKFGDLETFIFTPDCGCQFTMGETVECARIDQRFGQLCSCFRMTDFGLGFGGENGMAIAAVGLG